MAVGSMTLNKLANSFSDGKVKICAIKAGSAVSDNNTALKASNTDSGSVNSRFSCKFSTFKRTYFANNICAAS